MSIPNINNTAAAYGGGTHIQKGKSGNPYRTVGGTLYFGGTPGLNGFNQQALTAPAITQSIGNATAIAGITSLFSTLTYRTGLYENLPYYGSNAGGVNRGISGDFAKVTAGRYIIFGVNSLPFSYIAGTLGSNTALLGNAGQHPWRNAFGPYIRTTLYITKIANGGPPNGWDYVTGDRNTYGTFSNDLMNVEKNPGSYAIPGDIVFLSTSSTTKDLSTIKVLPAKTD